MITERKAVRPLFFLNVSFCTGCGIFTALIDNMSVCLSSATVQMDWKCFNTEAMEVKTPECQKEVEQSPPPFFVLLA